MITTNIKVNNEAQHTHDEEIDEPEDEYVLHPKLKCTICDFNLNSNVQAFKIVPHPILLVVPTCLLCNDNFITAQEDAENINSLDDFCSWCGLDDRNDLLLCSDENCHHNFCFECVKRNFDEPFLNHLKDPNVIWKCFKCQPSPVLDEYNEALQLGIENSIYYDSFFEQTNGSDIDGAADTEPSEEQLAKENYIMTLLVDQVDTANWFLEECNVEKEKKKIRLEFRNK